MALTTTTRDWDLYEKRTRAENIRWLRSLTPVEALTLYEDLHRLAESVNTDPGEARRMHELRWKEKLALRRVLVAAFEKLDRKGSGRTGSSHAH